MASNPRESVTEKLKSFSATVPLSQPGPQRSNRTTPGTMGDFMKAESAIYAENELLKLQVAKYDGAWPAYLLDPELIEPSRWANRAEVSFGTPEFTELLDEIKSAGGNIQPIKVRPVVSKPGRFEIVFGHRRHQACLRLGFKVLAMVEEMDDHALFIQMDRENRSRSDLRPFEQGMMYRRALENNLYKNLLQLCVATGASQGKASLALRLAQMEEGILKAFASPLDIQFRWIEPLLSSAKADLPAFEAISNRIRAERSKGVELAAAAIFDALTHDEKSAAGTPQQHNFEVNGRRAAALVLSNGRHTVKFEKGVLTAEKTIQLTDFLTKLLKP